MASRKRLTDAKVKALKPRANRYSLWDGNGFGVRVTPRGVKSFVWTYHFEGKPRRMTFGRYPDELTLSSANVKLAEAQAALRRGEDPGKALVKEHQEERQAETFEELAEDYIQRHALGSKKDGTRKKRSGDEDVRILRKDVIPRWRKRKAASIRLRDITDLTDAIADRGATIGANRTLSVVKKLFNWAVERGALDFSPAAKAKGPGSETARTRNMTPKEIKTFWDGLPSTDMHELLQLALKFSLVTAQRKGEVVKARNADFDVAEEMSWLIPAASSKNKLPHLVPLSPLAVALYKEIRALAGDSEFMFPSPYFVEDRPITSRSVSQALLRNLPVLGIQDVRPHDMRRAGSTGLASIGVPPVVRERILNHSQGRLDKAYDLHDYWVEKKTALNQWADKLAVILKTNETVVHLEATA